MYYCPSCSAVTLTLVLYGGAHKGQQTVRQPTQRLEVVNGQAEAVQRAVGNGLQLLQVGPAHTDGENNDALLSQALCWHLDIISRVAICEDHNDLRHSFARSAACLFSEELCSGEVYGFARLSAPRPVRKPVQLSQQGRLVHVVFEQELPVWLVAVLCQAHPDFVGADVKAGDDAPEELPDLPKVLHANAGGAIDQEDQVRLGGFDTF